MPADVEARIDRMKGGGQTLPQAARAFFEARMGYDFSRVRVHTDANAVQASRALNARAFTAGHHIAFNDSAYQPDTAAGQSLLAHELTHVVQQTQGRVKPTLQAQGVSINDDAPLEREADVVGAQALQLSRKDASQDAFRQQGIEGESLSEEEEPAKVQIIGNTIPPVIQRSTKWDPATVHETINFATMYLFGGSPISWHMLNGTKVTSDAAAEGAIKAPTISTSGSGTAWKAKVDKVELNTGSDDETVLSKGPWTQVVPKSTVGAKTGLAACTGAADTTFRGIGKPSDDAVYKANRRHEDHHVADDKKAFEETVGAWDKKLEKALADKTEVAGTSAADATSKLHTAMGGTPEEIARAYNAASLTKGAAYHATAKGGPMSTSNEKADATCTTSSVEVTNPS